MLGTGCVAEVMALAQGDGNGVARGSGTRRKKEDRHWHEARVQGTAEAMALAKRWHSDGVAMALAQAMALALRWHGPGAGDGAGIAMVSIGACTVLAQAMAEALGTGAGEQQARLA